MTIAQLSAVTPQIDRPDTLTGIITAAYRDAVDHGTEPMRALTIIATGLVESAQEQCIEPRDYTDRDIAAARKIVLRVLKGAGVSAR